MKKNTANLHGGLLINKPAGVTSHDIVNTVRHIPELKGIKVGHSGTLDPFASGLLIILVGHATRLQDELHMLPKTYRAEITLGATSDTDDSTGVIRPLTSPNPSFVRRGSARTLPLPEGELEGVGAALEPNKDQILTALSRIKQQTSQIPPAYAAIKINGKKMYEYARAGESVERKPRPITIHEIILEEYKYPTLQISVTCSTGTYIRSLARDIGEILGTGAYCSQLTRTAIGSFTDKNANSPEDLPKVIHSSIIPMEQLVSHIPSIICAEDIVAKYKQGKVGECDRDTPINTPIALLDSNKKLFGIAIRETEETIVQPKKIFL
ncbi:MAG: hypothetical protein A2805_04030 [Candidatus Andersenbacteria bacterium RIFCSPHIGHO2_01_FULL_46_36]|uniref:tRNA pseudouridine synthase B n=1 Tax=Candidatus Andersenbacteria bacterium RIFCSPHIGHO2_12_FULL_45_11 TaxID=1797281 RepID=A0A1G1X1M0_9BACT|nr:MAG: hypothetical protein A2805_04030 [Candidatus Andersenbacteria bacterium RIFCSPHIGHO2_01_FULL_46_36]OGY33873.1 MAG: hypothetical protein A3D99_04010 [Candidatus Andersenbacteria bacterium RIFCSPHIGHO2_12_FULL_45_11]